MKKLILACAVVVASGCMPRVPALQLEKSTTTIRHAEQLGAHETPLARVHLQRAREEQEAARRLANLGDPRAESVLACSEADAELAVALSHEAAARRQAVQAQNEVAALKWKGATP